MADETKKPEAIKEKELGNEMYKKREFEGALKHYDKAWELDDTNITILTNKAAVLFEMEKYEECIKLCEQAVEVGREHRADYKLIARALARIGNAHFKQDKLEDAIKYYQKSLTEHRTAEVLSKLRETEKLKATRDKEAYRDPALAEKARAAGNELFKANNFAEAVVQYTEAIKRNDTDPRPYSNRAACYIKLMAYNEALKDAETCVKLDPTFVRGYIRKASVEFLKKDYVKCMETCETAKQYDTEKKHAAEIDQQLLKCYMELNQAQGGSEQDAIRRAQSDPEIQKIIADPVMQQILSQMQSDPKAIQDHMKNPGVAANIRKLIAAGILRVA